MGEGIGFELVAVLVLMLGWEWVLGLEIRITTQSSLDKATLR